MFQKGIFFLIVLLCGGVRQATVNYNKTIFLIETQEKQRGVSPESKAARDRAYQQFVSIATTPAS